jgi:uncharacterized membrane protein
MTIPKILLAVLFMLAGINHFRDPEFYLAMMPPYIPMHELMVQLSGVAEFALGALLLNKKTTVLAAWGLIALLIAVLPANLYMAMNPELFPEVSPTALWLRVPMQLPLMAWVWIYARKK